MSSMHRRQRAGGSLPVSIPPFGRVVIGFGRLVAVLGRPAPPDTVETGFARRWFVDRRPRDGGGHAGDVPGRPERVLSDPARGSEWHAGCLQRMLGA